MHFPLPQCKYFCLFLFLILSFAAHSQQTWFKVFKHFGTEKIHQVKELPDESILLVGTSYTNSSLGPQYYMAKISKSGRQIFYKNYGQANASEVWYDVQVLPNGNFLAIGSKAILTGAIGQDLTLTELDKNGIVLQTKSYPVNVGHQLPVISKVILNGNNFIIAGTSWNGSSNNVTNFVFEVDLMLDTLWSFSQYDTTQIKTVGIVKSKPNVYSILQSSNYLTKIDSQGNLINQCAFGFGNLSYSQTYYNDGIFSTNLKGEMVVANRKHIGLTAHQQISIIDSACNFTHIGDTNSVANVSAMTFVGEGNYLLSGRKDFFYIPNTGERFFISKLDSTGQNLWHRSYGRPGLNLEGLSITEAANKDIIVAGYIGNAAAGNNGYFVNRLTPLGQHFPNIMEGYVYYDLDSNCVFDSTDLPAVNKIVEESNLNYGLTDSNGYYAIYVDSGFFNITVSTQRMDSSCAYILCPTTSFLDTTFHTVNGDTSTNNNFAVKAKSIPYLKLSTGTSRFVNCRSSVINFSYENSGIVAADSAYIKANIDSNISITTSSHPYTKNGNEYIFYLGTILPGQNGKITNSIFVNCNAILGSTACVIATIHPYQSCENSNSAFDSSFVDIIGGCNDSIGFFKLTNTGTGDMDSNRVFVLYQNDSVRLAGYFKLNKSDDTIINFSVTADATYNVIINQHPNIIGDKRTQHHLELCNYSGGIWQNFVLDFPRFDVSDWRDETCAQIVGSYDPNIKYAEPKGFGVQNNINVDNDLEYTIVFQNTGLDTAYKVVIVDSISNLLDLSTIVFGSSSHPYTTRLFRNNIVEFTFDNIGLPDSTTDFEGSIGYIKYEINQKTTNMPGDIIKNKADIYFDFNAPITTNTTFHTISDPIIIDIPNVIISPSLNSNVKLYPNPFRYYFSIESITSNEFLLKDFKLFDLVGNEIVIQHSYSNTKIDVNLDGNISNGMYIFKIELEDGNIYSGKLVKH